MSSQKPEKRTIWFITGQPTTPPPQSTHKALLRETNGYSLGFAHLFCQTPCFVGSSWVLQLLELQEDAAVSAAKAAAWMRQHELLGVTTLGMGPNDWAVGLSKTLGGD